MSVQMLSFENNEYDINGLFNLQINFEQLKFLLISMTKSIKISNQKISELEDQMNSKEIKIEEMEKHISDQNNFLSTKYRDFYSSKRSLQAGPTGKVLLTILFN
jgi:peptidoglycan hydrolase CwlO-like protein